MTSIPSHTTVLIVGAGPSGLMMAAQLLRNGIHPVIIDSKKSLNPESRALVVQARSLEIFRQMGADDVFLDQGNIVKNLAIHRDWQEVVRLDLSALGQTKTAFPYIFILEQSKTERILLNYLTANACPVYWNTELLDLDQNDQSVKVVLSRDGIEEQLDVAWVIGADGASSKVRRTLGIPFSGGTYEHKFYLADLAVRESRDEETVRIFLKDEGFVAFFPMQGESDRFIGVLPETLKARSDLSYDDIKPYLTYTLDAALQKERCNWFSIYQLHHRIADRFRVQRCFLIGDAAHVHSPAGGQGMNTGIQDAYNLAWKLAGVIKKEYDLSILDTYSSERIPVAAQLLKTTDKMFSVAVSKNWFLRKVRNWILPSVLKSLWKSKNLSENIFSVISQIGISYRDSKISIHHSQAKKIRAGDRLPYIKFFDEKHQRETDLHSWCLKAGFTLLIIGWVSTRDLMYVAKWIKETFPFNLNFYFLPHSSRNQHVFDAFEITKGKRKAIIVRPDLHIGYINDAVVIELIENYLKEIVGWNGLCAN